MNPPEQIRSNNELHAALEEEPEDEDYKQAISENLVGGLACALLPKLFACNACLAEPRL